MLTPQFHHLCSYTFNRLETVDCFQWEFQKLTDLFHAIECMFHFMPSNGLISTHKWTFLIFSAERWILNCNFYFQVADKIAILEKSTVTVSLLVGVSFGVGGDLFYLHFICFGGNLIWQRVFGAIASTTLYLGCSVTLLAGFFSARRFWKIFTNV